MWKNREDYYDRHHLIPRNPKEEKEAHGLSVDENVIKIRRSTHDAIHNLFQNEPPVSQIIDILELNKNCLTEEFYNATIEFIQCRVNKYYKKECYTWTLRAEIRRIINSRNIQL